MNEAIIILTTVSSQQEGRQISSELVNNQLAACVNIISQVSSIYFWNGKVHEDNEQLLIIKTNHQNEIQVYDKIKVMHSYTTPEIITLDVKNIDDKYANWLNSVIKTDNDKT